MSDPLQFSYQSTPALWACYYDPEGPSGMGKTKAGALRKLIEDTDGDARLEKWLADAIVAAIDKPERELAAKERLLRIAESVLTRVNAAAGAEIAALREALRDSKDALIDNNWERIAVRHLIARIDAALDPPHARFSCPTCGIVNPSHGPAECQQQKPGFSSEAKP